MVVLVDWVSPSEGGEEGRIWDEWEGGRLREVLRIFTGGESRKREKWKGGGGSSHRGRLFR